MFYKVNDQDGFLFNYSSFKLAVLPFVQHLYAAQMVTSSILETVFKYVYCVLI